MTAPLSAELLDYIKHNITTATGERAAFLEESLNRFRERFNRIQTEPAGKEGKFRHILSECLTELHGELGKASDLDTLLGNADLLTEWRQSFLSGSGVSETVVAAPYDDDFWNLRSTAQPRDRLRKIQHYILHPVTFLRARKLLPDMGKEPQRIFNPKLLTEAIVLHAVVEFQWQELRHLLLFYSGYLRELQESTGSLLQHTLKASDRTSASEYESSRDKQDHSPLTKIFAENIEQVRSTLRRYQQDAGKRFAEFLGKLVTDYSYYWRHAGTKVFSTNRFTQKKLEKEWAHADKKYKSFRENWINHLEAVKDEWQKDLELDGMQLRIGILQNEIGQLLTQKSQEKILPALDQLSNGLEKAIGELQKIPTDSRKELSEKLLLFSRGLQKGLTENELANAVDFLTNAHIARTCRGFTARTEDLVEQLNEGHVIIKAYNLDKFSPNTVVEEVRLKQIVREEIIIKAEKESEAQIARIAANLETLTQTVASLDQVLNFNFATAMDLIRQEGEASQQEQAVKIISEGIDRALGLVRDSRERYLSAIADGQKSIDSLAVEILQGIQELGDNEKIIQLKLRLARAKAQQELRNLHRNAWLRIKQALPGVLHILRNYLSQVTSSYRKVRRISGLDTAGDATTLDLSRYLYDEKQRLEQLPFIYQKLFDIHPLEEERFFLGRSQEMERIRTQFNGFSRGQIQLTAVVGEKGGGKTTLLNFACRQIFKGFPITRASVTETIWHIPEFCSFLREQLQLENGGTLEEIEHALNSGPRRILVVEDIHNLFLRIIDGFDVIEALLKLISATKEKVYWLVTSGIYGWQFLIHAVNIADFFSDTIELGNLDTMEIEQLILSRHNMSGFLLNFTATDDTMASRSYRRLKSDEEKQEYLRRRFFEKLTMVSGGNVKTSLIYWISSLRFAKPDEPLQVTEHFAIDESFVYQIKNEDLYYLAAYIQHEYLTVQEFALVFGAEEAQVQIILDRLNRRGYLTLEREKYFVPAILYLPVVQMLKVRNILY